MGFFDIFRKNKSKNLTSQQPKITERKFAEDPTKEDIRITLLEQGRKVQVEYYNPDPKIRNIEGYDITKVIIDKFGYQLGDSIVKNCLITWYGDGWVHLVENDVRDEYKEILASVDVNRILSDKNYCSFVMRALLNRKRVMGYLERGMSSGDIKYPCGNYVGGVRQVKDKDEDKDKFEKYFDISTGRESHYSEEMVQARRQAEQQRAQTREKMRIALEEQKRRIQHQLDEL